MIGNPPSGDSWLTHLAGIVREVTSRREARILGSRLSGTTWDIRFLAALASPYVQVHVQSTVGGEGGIADYDPANYTSSNKVDCREDRLQDVEVTVAPSESYVVFLVPIQESGDGTEVKFDGQSSRPDNMSFAMVST